MRIVIDTQTGQVHSDRPLTLEELDTVFILLRYAKAQLISEETRKKYRDKKAKQNMGDLMSHEKWVQFVKDYKDSNK